jgi:hypothetical protein
MDNTLAEIISFILGIVITVFIGSHIVFATTYKVDNVKPYLKVICTKDIKTLTEFEKDNFKEICLEGK